MSLSPGLLQDGNTAAKLDRQHACVAPASPKIVSSWEKADLVQMMNLPTWPPGASCSNTGTLGQHRQQSAVTGASMQTDKQTAAAKGQLQPPRAGRAQRQQSVTVNGEAVVHTRNSMM